MGIEAAGLQSGFVLGVVIAAFLLAGRLGGSEVLALRAAQLALGIVLTMLVVSATAAVIGPPDPHLVPSSQGLLSPESYEATVEFAKRSSVIGTIHLAVTIIFVAGGVALTRRWSALTPGFLLAGILLVLVGVPTGWPDGYGDPLYLLTGGLLPGLRAIGDERTIVRVVVLLIGAVVLVATIYFRWERDSEDDPAEAADAGALSP